MDTRGAPLRLRRRGPRRVGRPNRPVPNEALLAVARSAFAASGYGGTSLDLLAARTGLRKASLLHRFPSKQALYAAVLGQLVADLGERVRDARLDEGDFVARLDRLGELIVRYLGAHPDAARLLLREALDRGPFMRSSGRTAMLAALRIAADFLAAGMKARVFARQDPQQLLLSIVGVHLLYFAVADLSGALLGGDALARSALKRRAAALRTHVRCLVLHSSR